LQSITLMQLLNENNGQLTTDSETDSEAPGDSYFVDCIMLLLILLNLVTSQTEH